jgi:hypothetical protein
MSKWPTGAISLEQVGDKSQGLSSKQIAKTLKDWCGKYPDMEPSKVRIWVEAFSTADDKPNNPTVSEDFLKAWLYPKALTDGACYFALSDELEGYPIKMMRLFRKGKQYTMLFDLLDFVPWEETEEVDE